MSMTISPYFGTPSILRGLRCPPPEWQSMPDIHPTGSERRFQAIDNPKVVTNRQAV